MSRAQDLPTRIAPADTRHRVRHTRTLKVSAIQVVRAHDAHGWLMFGDGDHSRDALGKQYVVCLRDLDVLAVGADPCESAIVVLELLKKEIVLEQSNPRIAPGIS